MMKHLKTPLNWYMSNKLKNERYCKDVYLPMKQRARDTHALIKKNSEMKDILGYLEARHLLILDNNKNASDVHAEQLLDIEIEE